MLLTGGAFFVGCLQFWRVKIFLAPKKVPRRPAGGLLESPGAGFWGPRAGFWGPGDPFRGDFGSKLGPIFLGPIFDDF